MRSVSRNHARWFRMDCQRGWLESQEAEQLPDSSEKASLRHRIVVGFVALVWCGALLVPSVFCPGAAAADELSRAATDAAFQAQLQKLADKCKELGMEDQQQVSRAWFVPRDPLRHYLFLPPAVDPKRPAEGDQQLVRFWYDKFTEIRQQQATRLFALAQQHCGVGNEAEAFRLLHEVLHEDPDHARARWCARLRTHRQRALAARCRNGPRADVTGDRTRSSAGRATSTGRSTANIFS